MKLFTTRFPQGIYYYYIRLACFNTVLIILLRQNIRDYEQNKTIQIIIRFNLQVNIEKK